jgi:pSer/pThr/pTyr-binding forkhead associated (FHA) protein/S1-C subfamily serine protease
MARIVLKDLDTEKAQSIPETEAAIGRDSSCAFVIEGPKSKVVSGRHARIFFQDNSWWIEDTSRNGTILDDERLQSGQRHALRVGQVIGLGESGPRLRVSALESKQAMATIVEPPDLNRHVAPPQPVVATPPDEFPRVKPTTAPRNSAGAVASGSPAAYPDAAAGKTSAMRRSEAIRAGLNIEESTEPLSPAPDWLVHVVLRATNTNQRYDVKSMTVKLGRAPECNVQIPAEHGASVSRVHAEISILDGSVSVKDAGSRNGTYLNGKRLEAPHAIARSDLLMLGAGGPTFSVEELHIVKGQTPQPAPAADPTVTPSEARKRASEGGSIGGSATDPIPAKKRQTEDGQPHGASSNLRRSFAGVGRTAFLKDVLEDMSQKSAKRVRYVVWASVGTTIVLAAGILGYTQWRVAESERRIEAERIRVQAQADSAAARNKAEANQIRARFDSALSSSAPRAVIDSLRNALADASRRTGMLEQSLVRARQSLDQQLAAGDSARRRAEDDMTRLRNEVAKAQAGDASRAALDSLRRALRSAEEKANDVATQMRAVRGGGSTLARVSQANQGAVGLIFYLVGGSDPDKARISDGTGFVITRSGYMVTNRHNVADDAGNPRDTLYVTMADQRFGRQTRVSVVAVSRDYDLAIVKIPNYNGPFMEKLDWNGQGASQGEPAALIGFPGGVDLAFESTSPVIRTSMSAGIFSKVAADRIQFDGFSVKGSSGSPIFNANGEVVAVHFQGIAGNAGLSFSIPISKAIPLLPPDAKSELGLR